MELPHLFLLRQAMLCVSGLHKVSPLEEAEKQQVRFLAWSSNKNLHPDPVFPRTDTVAVVPGRKSNTSSYLEMSLTWGRVDSILLLSLLLLSSTFTSNCLLSFTLPGKMTRYGPASSDLMSEKKILQ